MANKIRKLRKHKVKINAKKAGTGKIGKFGKVKSSSAAKKRFALTGSGQIKAQKACRNHLLLQKSKRQKKLADKPLLVSSANAKSIARLLPSL